MVELLGENGLKRGENDLRVIMMCELPSNAVVADAFLDHFDGFSIGSNDMTQLTLGLDRDSALVANSFDERDPAVKFMLSAAIRACRARRGPALGACLASLAIRRSLPPRYRKTSVRRRCASSAAMTPVGR